MTTLEMVVFGFVLLTAIMVVFDYTVFALKNAPKRSLLSRRMWFLGYVCCAVLIYWYVNGMKFL